MEDVPDNFIAAPDAVAEEDDKEEDEERLDAAEFAAEFELGVGFVAALMR